MLRADASSFVPSATAPAFQPGKGMAAPAAPAATTTIAHGQQLVQGQVYETDEKQVKQGPAPVREAINALDYMSVVEYLRFRSKEECQADLLALAGLYGDAGEIALHRARMGCSGWRPEGRKDDADAQQDESLEESKAEDE